MAKTHKKLRAEYPKAKFTANGELQSWTRFVTHAFLYPPGGDYSSLGIDSLAEALKEGAIYVYRDRIEEKDETKLKAIHRDFDRMVKEKLKDLPNTGSKGGWPKASEKDIEALRQTIRSTRSRYATINGKEFTEVLPSAAFLPELKNYELISAVTLPDEKNKKKKKRYELKEVQARMKKVLWAAVLNDPLALKGPTATMKSAAIKNLAAKINKSARSKEERVKINTVAVTPGLSKDDLIGSPRPRPKGTKGKSRYVWEWGHLVRAMLNGEWLILEEMNLATTEVLEALNFYLVHGYLVVRERGGEPIIIHPHPRFRLFATFNPEGYFTRNKMSDAFLGRWKVKYFGELPPNELSLIIAAKYGITLGMAKKIVEIFYTRLRQQAKSKVIGRRQKGRFEINIRHLLKLMNRWQGELDALPTTQRKQAKTQVFYLSREIMNLFGAMFREDAERDGLFAMTNQTFGLERKYGIKKRQGLEVSITRIEETKSEVIFYEKDKLNANKEKVALKVKKRTGSGKFVPGMDSALDMDQDTMTQLFHMARALYFGEHVSLVGPTKTGKTSKGRLLSRLKNMNFHYINLNSDTAIEELSGGYYPNEQDGGYEWRDGTAVFAMEDPGLLFMDEANLSEMPEYINTILDDGLIVLPMRLVRAKDGFGIMMAMNPASYQGRNKFSPALRSRFTEIWIDDDPDEKTMVKRMRHWTLQMARGGMISILALALIALRAASGATIYFVGPW